MSDNTEKLDTSPKEDSPIASGSLLGDILWSAWTMSSTLDVDILSDSLISWDSEDKTENSMDSVPVIGATVPVKPQKRPISTGTFLRLVGAMLLVTLIFFGAFLAYIVFNPGQASFFLSLGINPGDITLWLRQLVRSIFGVATFILAIVWIIYLFKAILTKKEYKKKKTISIILAVFFGMLFFSEITLWAFLEKRINATDYENPNGGVIVYDNEKLVSERFKTDAKMNDFDNLIGPLTLKFDLKADVWLAAKLMDIEKYELDFDGAKCQWGLSSLVIGVNAQNDQSIICTFDQAKIFKPTGRYEGTDRLTHQTKMLPINFQAIQIVGVVDIQAPKSNRDKTLTYNATRLKNLGNISWFTEKNDDLVSISNDAIFSIAMKEKSQVLCLSILSGEKCDKLFIIPQIADSSVTGKIVYDQDKEDPLSYSFRVGDKTIKSGEITGYEWKINNITVSTEEAFVYHFPTYADVKILLILRDSAGNTIELSDSFSMAQPLKFTKGTSTVSLLSITDTSWKSLIDGTYDPSLRAYHVVNMSTPLDLRLDATDVRVENFGYVLSKVEWDFDNDGVFEKIGMKTSYELVEEKRYTFWVRYTFADEAKKTEATLVEKMIFESEKKDISLSLKLTQDSEYAPATIHVDGSASLPKEGTITKFMYDFGEGKWPIEGDAVQDYRYLLPGEYTITFTVVRDDGTKERSSRKLVLKDTPKHIAVNTSVSTGIVGKAIDFDTNGTVGQIEAYHWDFWDGSISSEPTPTHAYEAKGKYTVKITVTYADRTIRSTDRDITVVE